MVQKQRPLLASTSGQVEQPVLWRARPPLPLRKRHPQSLSQQLLLTSLSSDEALELATPTM